MTKQLPRGLRNFNPGNVDRGTDRWLGMSDDQSGDSRFIVFTAPEYGIRCVMRLLITYHERHGLNTLRGIINRWAPAQGKNPTTGVAYTQNTAGYIGHASRLTGFDPDEQLDLFDRDTNVRITKAIIRHENGDPRSHGLPEFWYDDDMYAKAAALAGFVAEVKPLAKSRTINGSIVAGGAAAAGAIYETLGESVGAATATVERLTFLPPDLAKWIFLAVVLMGTGAAIHARIDDSKKRVT